MRIKTKDLRKGDIIFFMDDYADEIIGIVTKIAHSVISPEELKIWVKYIGDEYEIEYDMLLRVPFDYEFSKVIRE